MWFRGLNKVSVDAKGRVAMPKNHRDMLEKSSVVELIVTASPAKCLNVYALAEWEKLEKTLMAVPNAGSKAVQRLQRMLLGYATSVELDGSGRMLLSSELREFAAIGKKAMFIGQGTKFEIWGEARWDAQFGVSDDEEIDMSDAPPELLNLSF